MTPIAVSAAVDQTNESVLAATRDFVSHQAQALDAARVGVDDREIACAYGDMQALAMTSALVRSPRTSLERDARVPLVSSIGFLVLKYRMHGIKITPDVQRWLESLAASVRNDYLLPSTSEGYHVTFGNMYPWAASVNAISALVSRDVVGEKFADEAWMKMTSEGRDDGMIIGEMDQGRQALVDHQIAANGLLVLRDVRKALGKPDDAIGMAKMDRLLENVGHSLCEPESIAAAAGARQDKPGNEVFRVSFAFGDGRLPQSWSRCGALDIDWFGTDYTGGDAMVAVKALRAAAKR